MILIEPNKIKLDLSILQKFEDKCGLKMTNDYVEFLENY